MTEVELLEYKIKQLVEDNKSAWSTIRATENARVKAEKERDELLKGWLRVIDDEMVCSHLGIANPNDNYEVAKQKLNKLICWNIDISKELT